MTTITTTTGYTLTQIEGYPQIFTCTALNGRPLPADRQDVLRLGTDGTFTDAATACEPCYWAGRVRTTEQ